MLCKWEELTSPDFARTAAQVKGVCLLPLGVLEKHGDHLPLGTDLLNVRAVAEGAVKIEPALLFPPYFFTQIQEARQWPGAIALRRELLYDLLENVCEEIGRNGLSRIVLLNGHGGNESFLAHFIFTLLERPRDYTVYLVSTSEWYGAAVRSPQWVAMRDAEEDHHGGEAETSLTMAATPDTVRLAQCRGEVRALGRARHLKGAKSSAWWYADYPDHYAGDARPATPAKGRYLLDFAVRRVAGILKAVKADAVTPRLLREYHSRTTHGAARRKR